MTAVPFPGFSHISTLMNEPAERLKESDRVAHNLVENSVSFKTLAFTQMLHRASRRVSLSILFIDIVSDKGEKKGMNEDIVWYRSFFCSWARYI